MSLKQKRFWQSVSVESQPNGFEIQLDGRPIKTPKKNILTLPTLGIAELVRDEWLDIEEEIVPANMPATRLSNSAIDTVDSNKAKIVDMLAEYANTDLLCYWADGPAELVQRQKFVWQPILDFCSKKIGTKIQVTAGVIPILQNSRAKEFVAASFNDHTEFSLAAMHDVVALSGSAFISFAWSQDFLSTQSAWEASQLDETWQIEQWGADEDSEILVAKKSFRLRICDKISRSRQKHRVTRQ